MTDESADTLEVDVPPRELFLIPDEVGAMLGVTRAELRAMRQAGIGPAYFTFGSVVRYLPSDVEAWRPEHLDDAPATG